MSNILKIICISVLLYSCAPVITKPSIGEKWVLKSSKNINTRIVTILSKENHVIVFSKDSLAIDTSLKAFIRNYTRYTLSESDIPLQRRHSNLNSSIYKVQN